MSAAEVATPSAFLAKSEATLSTMPAIWSAALTKGDSRKVSNGPGPAGTAAAAGWYVS
jgi:hypothetical protein